MDMKTFKEKGKKLMLDKIKEAGPPSSKIARAKIILKEIEPELVEMREKGYSLQEIADIISTDEIPVSVSLLSGFFKKGGEDLESVVNQKGVDHEGSQVEVTENIVTILETRTEQPTIPMTQEEAERLRPPISAYSEEDF